MTVYIDEIFAVNLLMDLLVLWATGRLSQRELSWWRLFLAALVGALYGVVIFFPNCGSLSGGVFKAICACLMVWIGFGRSRWQMYIKTVIYLYLVSFAFGGGTIALMYFWGERIVQTWSGVALVEVDFKLFWLIGAVVLLFLLVNVLQRSLSRVLERSAEIVSVQAVLRGESVQLRLLVDSGNCLTDPVTGKAVAVVQASYLQPLFTAEEFARLEAGILGEYVDITETALRLPGLAGRIRMIPYRTVGYQGLLLGVRSDCLQIKAWGIEQPGVVLALSPQHFTADGAYQGIIAPAHLQ